tara:strand:- start:1487 stop:1711 length:225 start_codon:yes stop_codon:yes gene_type:complete
MNEVTDEIHDRAHRMLEPLDGMPLLNVLDTITYLQAMILVRHVPVEAQASALQRCRDGLNTVELELHMHQGAVH